MKIEIKHKDISNIDAYSFEIISKGEYTKKIIEKFANLEKLPESIFSSTHHVGIYDFSVKLKQWKVNDTQKFIEEIEKNTTNEITKPSLEIIKDATTRIVISIWEPEFLPFNFIILNITFNEKKLDLKKSYKRLSLLLRPIVNYWKTFDGMITSDDHSEFSFPVFYRIFYDSSSIKPELNKIMDDLKKCSKDELDITKYLETSNNLKKFFLLEHIDDYYNLISLLQIQNDFFMIGNIGQFESDFATVFSLEPNIYTYSGNNPFFASDFSWPFPALFLSFVLLASPIFWLHFNRKKLMEILTNVNKFKITYKTEDYLKSNSEKALSELHKIDNDLNFILSELKDIKTINDIFNSYFISNPEIQDKSVVITKSNNVKESLIKNKINTTYLETCNQTFRKYNTEIEGYTKDLQKDISFIGKRIESLQKELDYKLKSKQNTIFLLAAISTLILTGTLVGFAVVQYNSNIITSELLTELRNIETNSLLTNYYDFELELEYSFDPITPNGVGGVIGDIRANNYGSYDSKLIHQWKVTRFCDYGENIHEIDLEFTKTIPYNVKRDDGQSYLVQIENIFPNHTEAKSFELFFVVSGHPMSPFGSLEQIERRSTTKMQYDLVDDTWFPRFNESVLDCEPLDSYSMIKLDTKNEDHFYKLE